MRYTDIDTAAIVQWQNAALWQRMSWVRNPLAAPITSPNSRAAGALLSNDYYLGFAIGSGMVMGTALVACMVALAIRRSRRI